MCDPVSLAIGSTVMNIAAANQQHKAQQQQYEANKQNALQAQKDEQRQINLEAAQEDTKAAEKKVETDLNTRVVASRAAVAGGESGATLNNNAVLQDIERQGLMANTAIDRNLGNTMLNLQEQRLGAKTRAQSRINSVSRPSRTATGLKIGQAVVGGMRDSGKFT
jgi:hemolysin activation/secretion protein